MMNLNNKILITLLNLIFIYFSISSSFAQSNIRPIQMLVGFPPGQATDLIARVLAQQLSKEINRPVIVENKSGQGGSIALGILAKSPADGSVISFSALASYAINPHLYKSVPYDTFRDIAPVALVADIPVVLVANADFKPKTFTEFIAYVKANPDTVMYSSSGNGTVSHLGMQDLKKRAGLEMSHIPYQGSARAMADLVSGQVQVGMDSVSATKQLIDAKKLNILAAASLKRLPMFPDVPTISESGFPGFEVAAWVGVCAPVGTPMTERVRLNQAITKIVNSSEFNEKLKTIGAIPHPSSIEEFTKFIKSEYDRWGIIVKATGASVE